MFVSVLAGEACLQRLITGQNAENKWFLRAQSTLVGVSYWTQSSLNDWGGCPVSPRDLFVPQPHVGSCECLESRLGPSCWYSKRFADWAFSPLFSNRFGPIPALLCTVGRLGSWGFLWVPVVCHVSLALLIQFHRFQGVTEAPPQPSTQVLQSLIESSFDERYIDFPQFCCIRRHRILPSYYH